MIFVAALVLAGATVLVSGLPPGIGWGMLLIAVALAAALAGRGPRAPARQRHPRR